MAKKTKKETFYLSKLFAPKEFKNSSLVPNDRWILSNGKDLIKTDKELKRTIIYTGLFALGAVAAISGGITSIAFVLTTPAAFAQPLAIAGALAVSTIAATTAFVLSVRKKIDFMKNSIAPRLKPEIGKRYAKMQAVLLKDKVATKLQQSLKEQKSRLSGFSLKGAMKAAQEKIAKKQDTSNDNKNTSSKANTPAAPKK